jgi:hypothetical protein
MLLKSNSLAVFGMAEAAAAAAAAARSHARLPKCMVQHCMHTVGHGDIMNSRKGAVARLFVCSSSCYQSSHSIVCML